MNETSRQPIDRWILVLPVVGKPGKVMLGRFAGDDGLSGPFSCPVARIRGLPGTAAQTLIEQSFGTRLPQTQINLCCTIYGKTWAAWAFCAYLPTLDPMDLAHSQAAKAWALVSSSDSVPAEAPRLLRWLIPFGFEGRLCQPAELNTLAPAEHFLLAGGPSGAGPVESLAIG